MFSFSSTNASGSEFLEVGAHSAYSGLSTSPFCRLQRLGEVEDVIGIPLLHPPDAQASRSEHRARRPLQSPLWRELRQPSWLMGETCILPLSLVLSKKMASEKGA